MVSKSKGYGITFFDIDETLFHTYAKVKVVKDSKVARHLTSREFNSYILGEDESFDVSEFKDSTLFRETSVPIQRTVSRLRSMIHRIKETKSYSRIILLTARADMHDKETFLKKFYEHGIDVSDKNVLYIERVGNKEGPTAEHKCSAVLRHLDTGIYRRCRMIDDDMNNIRAFLQLENNLPEEVVAKVRETYKLKPSQKPISFYALHVQEDGTLKKV